jgi:hypothetical protein
MADLWRDIFVDGRNNDFFSGHDGNSLSGKIQSYLDSGIQKGHGTIA